MPKNLTDYRFCCDRCGRVGYFSEMKKEWTGLWVCADHCWEEKHPQLTPRVVADKQTVPVARPDVPQTMGETTNGYDVYQWEIIIGINYLSATGITINDLVGITLDNGTVFWVGIDDCIFIGGLGWFLLLKEELPFAVSTWNKVYLPAINSETWI